MEVWWIWKMQLNILNESSWNWPAWNEQNEHSGCTLGPRRMIVARPSPPLLPLLLSACGTICIKAGWSELEQDGASAGSLPTKNLLPKCNRLKMSQNCCDLILCCSFVCLLSCQKWTHWGPCTAHFNTKFPSSQLFGGRPAPFQAANRGSILM